jgi:hypothetical protein
MNYFDVVTYTGVLAVPTAQPSGGTAHAVAPHTQFAGFDTSDIFFGLPDFPEPPPKK